MSLTAIDWNNVQDPMDDMVWDRLTTNFWLPEKIPVSNDLPSWRAMPDNEKELVKKIFAGLTLLDTLQSEIGAPVLQAQASTKHEEAVFTNIDFMESVHAKSYSTIFSTLCSKQEIEELFAWVNNDPLMQGQALRIAIAYESMNPVTKYAASVLLESFLFYSGFYVPLRLASEGRLTNTADIIRLILRDEGVHGFYIGYQYQRRNPTQEDAEWVKNLAEILYESECERTEQLYDDVGWTDEVKCYLRYNLNKALANLGLEPMFGTEQTQIPAYLLAALDIGTGESHDFFSGSGASYVMGKAEATTDEDWAWVS